MNQSVAKIRQAIKARAKAEDILKRLPPAQAYVLPCQQQASNIEGLHDIIARATPKVSDDQLRVIWTLEAFAKVGPRLFFPLVVPEASLAPPNVHALLKAKAVVDSWLTGERRDWPTPAEIGLELKS